ncbi:MAG: type II toxin-antitoxin system HicA family toxin [Bacteroidota bacterium]
MNKKQQETYESIFEKPVRPDILWADIEKLLEGLGATITEGRGSRVRVALNGVKAVFHRPHPERISDRGQVASVRRFLESANEDPRC